MASTLSVWVIFAVSFVACAYTLGRVFISANDFAFFNQAPTRSEPRPAKQPEPAVTEVAAEPVVEVAEPAGEHGAEDAEAGTEEEDEDAVPEEEFRDSRVSMMKFLEGAVSGLANEEFKLDSFNKFGCHLFLAGAAEACARAGSLGHAQFVQLLEKCVAVLGSKPGLAKSFSERYDEYLLEPKYAEMFRAGGSAMEAFQSSGGEDISKVLSRSLESWNKPAADAGSGNDLVAVMFTDLVGSTAMTQTHGDEGAQAVIRAHNQIVREALRHFDGSEVKHTGDGIMARFSDSANAVEGGLSMQRAFAEHNEANPDFPVNVRIGINTGTPIQEEDDLFGTTVQLAARICDKGATGEVIASNVVRELCAGKKIGFEDCGQFDLKGIEGPVTLYYAREV